MSRITAILLFASVIAQSATADDWMLVEFSGNPPACRDVAAGDSCWGTRSEIASFEMRSGETLVLPTSNVLPPAWVRLRHIWVYADDSIDGDFSITLDRTPIGARLQVIDGQNSYLQSLVLNEWVQLVDRGHNEALWARVSGPEPR